MLRKLYLSIGFTTLSLFAHNPAETLRITDINNTLKHIDTSKKDIIFEMKLATLLQEKSEKNYKNILPDYEDIKADCLKLLLNIALSTEFITTIEQVTNEQLNLIVDNLINYNDITIDPSFYPLEQKIKDVLVVAKFDEQKEQIFNIFYLVYAILRGSQTLLRKLKIKERQLIVELEHLKTMSGIPLP